MKLFKNIKNDLPASIVVFFVALPLCLGIALASGAPLFSGLIAGVVGGVVVASISGSSLGVSGPAAGLSVIVLSAILQLGFEVFLLAVVLAGILQIIMGFLKAGIIAYYFPSSVIKGMLSGIGIIIFIDQIPHAFGYTGEGNLLTFQAEQGLSFFALEHMLDMVTYPAMFVAIVSLTILIVWEKMGDRLSLLSVLPGPLVAVVFGILYQFLTSNYYPHLALNDALLVNVPVANSTSEFFSQFTFPDISAIGSSAVWITAITIAIVASLETLLCVEATDKLDPHKRTTPTNRELIAQGTGNMISGLIGGIPVTQVIVRSSANIQAKGKSKLSAIVHGVLLFISVISIPRLLNYIPLAVLASVLFLVGYKLAKPSLFRKMHSLGWAQFGPFVVTILGIVFLDLLKGIGLGMFLAFFIILRNSYKNSHFLKVNEKTDGATIMEMVLAEHVSFLNKGSIINVLKHLPENSEVTIDMRNSKVVDYDIVEIIKNFKETAEEKNIKFKINSPTKLITADY